MGSSISVLKKKKLKSDSNIFTQDPKLDIIKQDLSLKTVTDEENIDSFAKEMYANMPKSAALQHLLSEEAGKKAFMLFLHTEYASENLRFFIVSSSIQHLSLFNSKVPKI